MEILKTSEPNDFKIINIDDAITDVSDLIYSGYLQDNELPNDLLEAITDRLLINQMEVSL